MAPDVFDRQRAELLAELRGARAELIHYTAAWSAWLLAVGCSLFAATRIPAVGFPLLGLTVVCAVVVVAVLRGQHPWERYGKAKWEWLAFQSETPADGED